MTFPWASLLACESPTCTEKQANGALGIRTTPYNKKGAADAPENWAARFLLSNMKPSLHHARFLVLSSFFFIRFLNSFN